MPSLKEVRNRISSVKSTQQITKAMKMVAASKLRKAQDAIIQMRPFAQKLQSILVNISSGNESEVQSDYAQERPPAKVLLVVISSDRGLCGAFNSSIFKKTVNHIEEQYEENFNRGDLYILPLGKKSYEYFKKRDYKVIDDYWEIFSDLSFDNVREIAEYVMNEFITYEFDRVDLIYNEFKNVATQIQRTEQFLPIPEIEEEEENEDEHNLDFILEPSAETIINEVIPQSLKIQFYKALLESNASEHGARMTAMDKATENAGELLKELTKVYNQTRQAYITKEILEIVGGAEALEQNG
jgi:F-type H+-transporting ATPase subunit gamma